MYPLEALSIFSCVVSQEVQISERGNTKKTQESALIRVQLNSSVYFGWVKVKNLRNIRFLITALKALQHFRCY
jgi:hypothetical protein